MTQLFITPTIVAREALLALENNCVLANLFHRDYSREFQKVGATVLIRKPATFVATAFSTTVAAQEVVEASVPVVLDKHMDVTFEITTQELSLDIVSFSEQVIQPAMRAHAQALDAYCAALYADIAGHSAVSATAAISDITNLRAQLNIQKVPFEDRRCVLGPVTEARYLAIEAFLTAEKRGDTRVMREASMGRVLGMDFFVDQNIVKHDGGISDEAGTFNTGAAAGATAATIAALTDGDVIAAGDVVKFAGSERGYLIVTGGTVVTNTCAITFTPATDAAIAADAAVTFQKDHYANLAFHKNAFAFVTAPLEPPLGGAKSAIVTYKGLSCRVVYDYTMSNKKNQCSIDILYGLKTLDKELAARLCDAQ